MIKDHLNVKITVMKKLVCFLIVFILFSYSQLIAQLYTASEYWKMENDPAYTSLLFRQQAGETLSVRGAG